VTLKVTFDINVWITGILGPGTEYPYLPVVPPTGENASADCLSMAFDGERFQVFVSPHIIRNIFRIIRESGVSKESAQRVIDDVTDITLLSLGGVVEPARSAVVQKDFEDNLILDLALQTKSQIIVTRDQELLAASGWKGIAIIEPRSFVNLVLSTKPISMN
jgi:predicted nucleic acid-binding protein